MSSVETVALLRGCRSAELHALGEMPHALLRRSTSSRAGPMRTRLALPGRSLRRRIERADALDVVAEQLDAQRQIFGRRPDVDDAAAPRRFARRRHLRLDAIAAGIQRPQQIVAAACARRARRQSWRPAQLVRRERALRNRRSARDDDRRCDAAPRAARRARRARPLHIVGIRREALVWQRVALREEQHAARAIAAEPRCQLVRQRVRVLRPWHDDEDRRATRRVRAPPATAALAPSLTPSMSGRSSDMRLRSRSSSTVWSMRGSSAERSNFLQTAQPGADQPISPFAAFMLAQLWRASIPVVLVHRRRDALR